MSYVSEIVYIARNNKIDLLFLANDVISDFTSITKIDLIAIDDSITISSSSSPTAFDWVSNGKNGIVTLTLGNENVPEGTYNFEVIVYDPSNINGIVWDSIKLIFKAV